MNPISRMVGAIVLILCTQLPASYGENSDTKEGKVKTLIEFLPKETREWSPINDTVMGGVSSSTIEQASENTAVFKGVVSLENNGGFASIRSRPQRFDLEGHDGIKIRVRGDGKKYKFRIRTDNGFDGPSHQSTFETEPDTWSVHQLPFADFIATYRGRQLRNHPAIDPATIRSFGFLVSDKQEGPFSLEIDWIGVY